MPSGLTFVLVPFLLAAPAVISWLWLVIVPLRVTKLCPEECWCDVGGYHVDCSGTSLYSIPSIYFTHVQELVLSGNKIISLEKDSFISKGLTELDVLTLDRCGLQTIELGAFNGLTKLTHLSMRGNWLGEITRSTFENMSGLEYVDLRYNNIEHLDVDAFSGLINLQHIDLEGNNLQTLHPDIFIGLPKLERLDLSINRGLQTPTDRPFIASRSLKVLNINLCNVSSVSAKTFANVSALERLNLRQNNLKSVDIEVMKSLPKLSELYLEYNPLQCDCQLKEVWQWCQDNDVRKCGIPWQCLIEKLQCVQDNVSNTEEYKQKHYKPSIEETESIQSTFIKQIILAILYLFLSILGTAGNIFILIIIICNKVMRTLPNMYIVNLAISDLIFLMLPIADITIYSLGLVKIPEFLCTFFTFWNRMSVGLSAYSVAVLSIQRYRLIVNPLHVRVSSQPIWRVIVSTVCAVWIVAGLFATPSALSKFMCSGRIMEKRNMAYYKRVFAFELFVFCVLSLFVIAFFYIMAARHLVKSADPIFEETQNPQLNKRKNIAKYVMGLTVVFMISYVPYYGFWGYIVFNLGREIRLSDWTDKYRSFEPNSTIFSFYPFTGLISYGLFLMNSSLNPVALFCTSSQFRKHLKRYLCCCRKANSPPTDIELARRI